MEMLNEFEKITQLEKRIQELKEEVAIKKCWGEIIDKQDEEIFQLHTAVEFTKVESDVSLNKGKAYYYMQLQRINERATEALGGEKKEINNTPE